MNLQLFFDPVKVDVDHLASSFQSSIYINHEKMPDYEGLDMVLIGLNEYRGTENDTHIVEESSADHVRHHLYKLKKGFGKYAIADLGNLRNGPTLDETYHRMKEVCSHLMEKGIVPILIGGSHDLSLGQYYAYEDLEKLISVINIDSKLDIEGKNALDYHLITMFKHSPNYLFNYSHIAYQSYLTHPEALEMLSNLSFEAYRLGLVKENIREMEPIIREADMLSFDLSAVQEFYAPHAISSNVFGLTGEEACQLLWYAGQNEKLSSVGLYNFKDLSNEKCKTSFTVSTMIWYFIEGYYHRKQERGFMSNDYIKCEVFLEQGIEKIKFYKSKLSDKWWMEIPNDADERLFNRNKLVACSYSDYERATNGEIPDRWLAYLDKR